MPTASLLIRLKSDVNGQRINFDQYSLRYSKGYSRKFFTMTGTVRLLVAYGADVNAVDMTYSTPLHVASLSGVPEVVRILIEGGAEVNAQDETHLTPLHMASLFGDLETVQLLIKHGADVTGHDWNHKTPLHFASSLVSTVTASFLFVLSIVLNGQYRDSNRPPDLKVDPNAARADIVRILIKHGADVIAQDKTHLTPMHIASSHCFAEIVQLLIEHGADVNAQNESHMTPLHMVSSWVRANAGIYLRTDSGKQEYTASQGSFSEQSIAKAKTVRLLLEHGADVNTHDDAYSTPLHLAASRGSAETVQILLEHGANVAAQDGRYMTPLHLASSVSRVAVS